MKLLVELAWGIVAFTAFCLTLYALNDLHVSKTLLAWSVAGVGGLVWATWHTHWKH